MQTDCELTARRPETVLINKDTKNCQIIEVTIPRDARIITKQEERTDEYQDLSRQIPSSCRVKAKVILIVIGALRTILQGLNGQFYQIGTLLGTARTLKMVLQGVSKN